MQAQRRLKILDPIAVCTKARQQSDEELTKFFKVRRWQDEELFDSYPVRRFIYFGTLVQLLSDYASPATVIEAKKVINCMARAGWNICFLALGYASGAIRKSIINNTRLNDDQIRLYIEPVWNPDRSEPIE